MELKVADEGDKNSWDDLVFSSDNSTLYHTWDWLVKMNEHSSIKVFSGSIDPVLYRLMAYEGSELYGLIPLYVYKFLSVNIVFSPPVGVENSYLGPVIKKYDDIKLRNKYSKFIVFQKVLDGFMKDHLMSDVIKIDMSPFPYDPRSFIWSGYSVVPRHTYVLSLKEGKDVVWTNIHINLRSEIKKARKAGIVIEEGSKEHIDQLFDLMVKRGRIHTSREYIHDIYDDFSRGYVKLFIAKKDDQFLTGVLITYYKKKVDAWIGAPGLLFGNLNLNGILLWHTIEWACSQGYDYYEIIGADTPELFPFKNKFNAELRHYYSMRWYSPLIRIGKGIYHSFKPEFR
ncbi:GNAT family N-acetyltransferase [Methanoplanus limicola]|uniref:BioF2-like acetyltransferase domain-containing protein n=1 Tax=Methanoplanus limicola DSM 2279 TaxID=937775 RepID=H1YZQ5_9EURY|nr:GNAT family N-acetyltransferase [Methanoplanus limicola]EHQ34317.1 hypothetical protein Metlim_0164 [Methanoplanus limicola DSM 2279]